VIDLSHLTPAEALREVKRLKLGGKAHKYGARRTEYRGETYDSAAEASYAERLDLLKAAGAIKEWGRGAPIVLVPGKRRERIEYRPDFWVIDGPGGNGTYYVDVKGVETAVWKLKMRLLRHTNPTLKLLIVGKKGERWL
jgi:hypothetical protein